jgi:hypothetical protein
MEWPSALRSAALKERPEGLEGTEPYQKRFYPVVDRIPISLITKLCEMGKRYQKFDPHSSSTTG